VFFALKSTFLLDVNLKTKKNPDEGILGEVVNKLRIILFLIS